jgi:signal transduction histidine kinase
VISLFEVDDTGTAEERVLARARLALAAASLFALYRDPTEPSLYAAAAYTLLATYVIASTLYLLALGRMRVAPRWMVTGAHVFDVLWLVSLTSITGASSSPLFPFFTFVVLSAAFRWGYVETLATTFVILCVFLVEGLVFAAQSLLSGTSFELNWFLVRISYIAIAGVLLAYLASHQKQLRLESALVARILSRLRSDTTLDAALQSAGRELLRAFGGQSLVIAVRQSGNASGVLWTLTGDDDIQRSALSAAEVEDYLAKAPSAFMLKRRGKRVVLVGTPRGTVGAMPSPVSLPQTLSRALVASAAYPDDWSGRVFIFDPTTRVSNVGGLRVLARVMEFTAPALHSIFLIGRLRSRSEAMERSRLARELHDTSVQSLIGLEMEVLALSRRIPDSTLRGAVTSIHSRLQQEIRSLRNLMMHLSKSAASASSLTDRLTEMLAHFQVETGIRSRFVCPGAVVVPSRLGQEIQRLVEAALSNVRRHSGATFVDVALGRHGDGWRLIVEDDGLGFRIAGRGGMRRSITAPWSIRERVETLGGQLVVERRQDVGVRIEITLPPFILSA